MECFLKNNIKITLRSALVSDAPKILEYMKIVNSESKNLMRDPEEFTMTLEQEEGFIKNVIESENDCMLVAFHGDKLISTAGFHGNHLNRVKHRVSMGISVLEEYQNLGLGKIIMNTIIEKAKEKNKTKIDLDVRIDNDSAIHLYKSVGFIEEGIIRNGFYVDNKYVDLLVMGIII